MSKEFNNFIDNQLGNYLNGNIGYDMFKYNVTEYITVLLGNSGYDVSYWQNIANTIDNIDNNINNIAGKIAVKIGMSKKWLNGWVYKILCDIVYDAVVAQM